MRLDIRIVILGFFLLIVFLQSVLGIPPVSTEFYGSVKLDNASAPNGTVISLFDGTGILCGFGSVVYNGYFGVISCVGDDSDVSGDQGAVENEEIFFKVGIKDACSLGEYNWSSGAYHKVELWAPCYCGDGVCYRTENCETCKDDCGECTGEGDSGGGSNQWSPKEVKAGGGGGPGMICKEKWVCTEWSACQPTSLEYRTCRDLNQCGSEEDKPEIEQGCIYVGTCYDGISNCHDGGCEEAIDCGGPCALCPSCFDGIKNCHDGLCEKDIDCGGPCSSCGNCSDGLKNCHDGVCELGIDCGGSCEACEEKEIIIEKPKPILCGNGVCDLGEGCSCISDCRSVMWELILITTIVILILIIYKKSHIVLIKHIKRRKVRLHKKKIIARLRRHLLKIYRAGIIAESVAVIFTVFFYYVLPCMLLFWTLLFLPILLSAVVSVFVYHLFRRYLYDERRKLKKELTLLKTHEKQVKRFLHVENEIISELELDLAKKLYALFSRIGNKIGKIPHINDIYSKLTQLSKDHKEQINHYKEETQLCKLIYQAVYIKSEKLAKDVDIKSVLDDFVVLYKRFEHKQKMYNELVQVKSDIKEILKKLRARKNRA